MKGLMTVVLSIGLIVSSGAIAYATDENEPISEPSADALTTNAADTSSQFILPTIDFEEVAESLEIRGSSTHLIRSDEDIRPEESNNIEVVF